MLHLSKINSFYSSCLKVCKYRRRSFITNYIYILFIFLIMLTGNFGVYAADCLSTSPIGPNQTVNASLDGSECFINDIVVTGDFTYYDLYELTLASSAQIKVTMSSDVIDSYLVLAREGFLANPNDLNNIIDYNDDANESTFNSEITASLEPGTYIIVANEFDDYFTGPYTLQTTSTLCSGPFDDVPCGYWAESYIDILASSGITAGCGNNNYCPTDLVTRAQMAVFLERGMRGSDYNPGSGVGNIFLDVPVGYWAGGWIEQLYMDGITAGCGSNNYCPGNSTTRAQMAVFLLRAKYGQDYVPPTPVGVFNDVPLTYWAVGWIEQLAAEGITAGCGDGNYCPNDSVTRAQMAVFLVRTFGLN